MARRGFTLLELMIVIIIIGVLATVGIMQYTATIEKSRGAEARQVLGSLRSACAAIFMQDNNVNGCTNAGLRIATETDSVPLNCRASNYFEYEATPTAGGDNIVLTATRCIGAAGKQPGGKGTTGGTLTLTTDYGAGTDTWGGTGGY